MCCSAAAAAQVESLVPLLVSVGCDRHEGLREKLLASSKQRRQQQQQPPSSSSSCSPASTPPSAGRPRKLVRGGVCVCVGGGGVCVCVCVCVYMGRVSDLSLLYMYVHTLIINYLLSKSFLTELQLL